MSSIESKKWYEVLEGPETDMIGYLVGRCCGAPFADITLRFDDGSTSTFPFHCVKEVPAVWILEGYDTFASAWYPIDGTFTTEALAIGAALDELALLEITQPTATSGGQEPEGIQDRVYVVGPDKSRTRVTR